MIVVSLFDKKALTYSPINCVPNVNAFVRVLSDEINSANQSKEIWAVHPEDFTLVSLGTFDELAGILTSYPSETMLVELSTLVRS